MKISSEILHGDSPNARHRNHNPHTPPHSSETTGNIQSSWGAATARERLHNLPSQQPTGALRRPLHLKTSEPCVPGEINPTTPRKSSRRCGSALLTVLWLTAALSAIGLAVASNVRGETERTATGVDDTKAYFVARGAIERAALHFQWINYADEAGQPLYYRAGQPKMELDFPTAHVTVDLIPETARLNVNYIKPEELLRLLTALSVPIDRATELTSAILDWRTPADGTRESPFDAFYLAQAPSFLPRHASFQENEELLQVKGMTSSLYYGDTLDNSRPGLRDCLSVFGSSNSVDVNTAQSATLQAVGLNPEDAAAILQRRAIRPVADFREFADLQRELGHSGARLTLGGLSMYTFRATARLKASDGKLSDLRRTVAALIHFTFADPRKGTAPGFEVLRWFDRT